MDGHHAAIRLCRFHAEVIAEYCAVISKLFPELVPDPVFRESGGQLIHRRIHDVREHDAGKLAVADKLLIRTHIVQQVAELTSVHGELLVRIRNDCPMAILSTGSSVSGVTI